MVYAVGLAVAAIFTSMAVARIVHRRRTIVVAYHPICMAFDEKLADRIRKTLGKTRGVSEKKMFDSALEKRHTRLFDITGRPMKGWLLVEPAGCATETALDEWVSMARAYAGSLPKK